jgi:uncharacterized membrane protein YcjF (UPF0283 family)
MQHIVFYRVSVGVSPLTRCDWNFIEMRLEFVLLFVMTVINLGVKYRLMLFSKYGFISRVLCARAFVYVLIGISSVCKKFMSFLCAGDMQSCGYCVY